MSSQSAFARIELLANAVAGGVLMHSTRTALCGRSSIDFDAAMRPAEGDIHCISIPSQHRYSLPSKLVVKKAAKAFLKKAIELVRLYIPVTIVTDKAHSSRRVIREINQHYDPHFDSIRHIDKKWRNNLIESDHAAMKRLLG